MKDSLVQILAAAMALSTPPPDYDRRPEKRVSRKGTNPPAKKSILKKKASKKATNPQSPKTMKKLALIDLDVIDASILENIKKHESLANGTPSKMLVSGKLTAFAEVSQGLSSQPALVALLLKAWEGGSEAKRCEFWMDIPTSFTDFLTQNNLTDETT